MVQVVRRKMVFVNAHRQQSNLFGQVTVGIPVNKGHLIAVIQQVGPIVGKRRLNALAFIDDAVVFHLDIGRRLEIDSAFITLFRAAENTTQISVNFESFFRCRHPQSSRSAWDTELPPW